VLLNDISGKRRKRDYVPEFQVDFSAVSGGLDFKFR
jgi:hypothetical protein